MLKKIFRRAPAEIKAAPAIPAGQRVYAIGDIHGRHDLLVQLLAQIDADTARRGPAAVCIIFLGDLMDRGPGSAAVIATARALAATRGDGVRFIMGNHEEMFLDSARGKEKILRHFVKYGGRETILSYGIDPADYDALSFPDLADRMLTLIPRADVDFVADFEPYVQFGDYVFTHAGIKPGVPLDEQQDHHLRWIREPFLDDARDHGAVIIHGHTITADVDEKPNRIGIDTGAYFRGKLTAIGLEGEDRWYVQAQGAEMPELMRQEWKG